MYLQHSFIQTENSSRCSLGRKQTRLYNISYRSCGPTDISIHRLVDATLYITDGCSFQNSHSNSYTGSQLNSHLDLLTPFSFSFGSLALRFSFSFGSDASPKTSFSCQNFLLWVLGVYIRASPKTSFRMSFSFSPSTSFSFSFEVWLFVDATLPN